MNNFLPLSRELANHWLWEDKPFARGQAWIDLLILANYEDKKVPRGNKVITLKRGDVNTSINSLSKRWGWDRKTVGKFLEQLESDGMVLANSSPYGTTITIVNYDVFNGGGAINSQQVGQLTGQPHTQPTGQPCPNRGKEKERSKEREKNIKKGKEENISPLNPPVGESGAQKPRSQEAQSQIVGRLLSEFPMSDCVLECLKEWLEYKREQRFTYRERGLKALVRQISENARRYGDGVVIDAINNSIASGYKGIAWKEHKARAEPENNFSESGDDEEPESEELVGDNW